MIVLIVDECFYDTLKEDNAWHQYDLRDDMFLKGIFVVNFYLSILVMLSI